MFTGSGCRRDGVREGRVAGRAGAGSDRAWVNQRRIVRTDGGAGDIPVMAAAKLLDDGAWILAGGEPPLGLGTQLAPGVAPRELTGRSAAAHLAHVCQKRSRPPTRQRPGSRPHLGKAPRELGPVSPAQVAVGSVCRAQPHRHPVGQVPHCPLPLPPRPQITHGGRSCAAFPWMSTRPQRMSLRLPCRVLRDTAVVCQLPLGSVTTLVTIDRRRAVKWYLRPAGPCRGRSTRRRRGWRSAGPGGGCGVLPTPGVGAHEDLLRTDRHSSGVWSRRSECRHDARRAARGVRLDSG
jgi:hypothetical protein